MGAPELGCDEQLDCQRTRQSASRALFRDLIRQAIRWRDRKPAGLTIQIGFARKSVSAAAWVKRHRDAGNEHICQIAVAQVVSRETLLTQAAPRARVSTRPICRCGLRLNLQRLTAVRPTLHQSAAMSVFHVEQQRRANQRRPTRGAGATQDVMRLCRAITYNRAPFAKAAEIPTCLRLILLIPISTTSSSSGVGMRVPKPPWRPREWVCAPCLSRTTWKPLAR